MELKIEDLKAGDELVCIDRDGFINGSSPRTNKNILEHPIIISHFGEYGAYLTVDFWLEENELKYFHKKPKLQFSDLEVGDYVYVRDSLEHGEKYGDRIFVDGMDGMIKGGFIEIHRKYTAWISNHGFDYTPEMLDLSRSMKKEDYLKMQEKEYSFDDLIDIVSMANKDRVISGYAVIGSKVNCLTIDGEDYNLGIGDDVEHGIRFIQSLYKETFVIETEEDMNRISGVVNSVVLSNGEEIINIIRFHKNKPCFAGSIDRVDIPFCVLKGATVTQSK